jgi:hypothetical protein
MLLCAIGSKDRFLRLLKDSKSQDSVIGSKIITRSRRNESCASNLSSVSAISDDTKKCQSIKSNFPT